MRSTKYKDPSLSPMASISKNRGVGAATEGPSVSKKGPSRRDKTEVDEEEEMLKNEQMQAHVVGISQLTCGPITGAPVDPAKAGPSKGEVLVPKTKSKEERGRGIKDRGQKEDRGLHTSTAAVGDKGLREQEPMEFVHVKTEGRNYALLQ
ncbi:unnamed protein product, partial [Choristocarpus tenellus]